MPKADVHTIFTRRLKKARISKGLTQAALGVRMGLASNIASTRINRYEVGTSEPDLLTSERMAKKLGVNLSWLVCTDPKLATVIEGFSKLDARQQDNLVARLQVKLATPVARKRLGAKILSKKSLSKKRSSTSMSAPVADKPVASCRRRSP
jgi:transcriptional regulator with XRE-family HTH domain